LRFFPSLSQRFSSYNDAAGKKPAVRLNTDTFVEHHLVMNWKIPVFFHLSTEDRFFKNAIAIGMCKYSPARIANKTNHVAGECPILNR